MCVERRAFGNGVSHSSFAELRACGGTAGRGGGPVMDRFMKKALEWALAYFALTLFVSAFLLFLVQPMIGKMILPRLGGTPQVWNNCKLFFHQRTATRSNAGRRRARSARSRQRAARSWRLSGWPGL